MGNSATHNGEDNNNNNSNNSNGTTTTTSSSTQRHHKIVALEGYITPIPDLTPAMPPGHTFSLEVHERTPIRDAAAIAARLADADIAIITIARLTASVLAEHATPRLRLVAVLASGHEVIDLPTARARSVVVSNSPGCNVDAVAEHALALHLDARRRVGLSRALLARSLWPGRGLLASSVNSPDGRAPLPMKHEVIGILGYGGVGKQIAARYRALGVERVLIAGRKGKGKGEVEGEGRTSFEEVLRTASTIFLCVPRNAETLGMIAGAEFAVMRPQAVVVNVSRGGIVDEDAALEALRTGRIAGYATDVFQTEPAEAENSALVRAAVAAAARGDDAEELNLVMTPHTAWCSEDTTLNYQKMLIANIRAFLEGKPQNVVS